MMRLDPFLCVKRMVVDKGGVAVYDEAYHEGLNIIRGENSSGKSTILNLLFYGLGGDLATWSDAAKICDRVTLEIELNGKPATLRRGISTSHRKDMDIFGGVYETALKAPATEWVRFPYARVAEKESFSQAMFRHLGIPEASNEMSGNITMHQVLRLLYSDQLSPVESIFRFEQFDSPNLRDSVGRLLCGAFDGEFYANSARIKALGKELDAVSGQLSSLFGFLKNETHSLTEEWLAAERKGISERISERRRELSEIEGMLTGESGDNKLTLEQRQKAYNRLIDAQSKLSEWMERKDSQKAAINDSALFIRSLLNKQKALEDAKLVGDEVERMQFMFCPACFTEISEHPKDSCHLCKSPLSEDRPANRVVGLINDISIQINQSERIQKNRKIELEKLLSQEASLVADWNSALSDYESVRSNPTSKAQARINEINREIGFLERDLQLLNEKAKYVIEVARLSHRKSEISAEISKLESRNQAIAISQKKRLSAAYTSISENTKDFLRHDLRRQDAFEMAEHVWFDFGANRITVDNQEYFSASSRVILKNSFFLAFIKSALENSFFRHPRFCIMDTMEDKGIEPIRSHNFQNMVAEVSISSKTKHQIIFATANISPDLDDEKLTVGRYYTRDEPSLAVQV